MKILLRLLKWLLLTLIVAIGLVYAYVYVKDPVLAKRFVTVPMGNPSGPLETVPGAPGKPLPVAATPSIATDALAAAKAYADETGSHALIIWHDDAIQFEHYWPGYDAASYSATQSMHKSVLAILVGQAIAQGHIGSVDDPAANYLTEWASDERSKVTLRHMLRQVSGVDFPTFGPDLTGGFFQLLLGGNITPVALNLPLEVPPGTRFDYNSVNPQNMGLIIERATGKRYAQYLSEALWQRIGADDARVVLDSEEHRMARTACCLDATARSWLRVGLLHIDGGRIGGEQVVPEQWMRDVATPSEFNPNYGYFTWLGGEHDEYRYYNRKTSVRVLHSEPYVAPDVIYFDGFGGARVYAIPSERIVIVRTGAITPGWDDAKLPNIVVRGLGASQPVSQ